MSFEKWGWGWIGPVHLPSFSFALLRVSKPLNSWLTGARLRLLWSATQATTSSSIPFIDLISTMPCGYIFLIDINITFLPLDRLYLYSSAADPEEGPGGPAPPPLIFRPNEKGLTLAIFVDCKFVKI